MCLLKVVRPLLDHEEQSGIGYKVFRKSLQGRLISLLREFGTVRQEGVWLKSSDETIRSIRGDLYPSGFHIYKKREDAEKLAKKAIRIENVIRKVSYRKAHTLGLDVRNSAETVIAKEMLIEEVYECQ